MGLFDQLSQGGALDALEPIPAAPTPKASLVRASFDAAFDAAGAEYGVDPDILRGMAYAESRFRPDVIDGTVRSNRDATGLMQFLPGTARQFGINPLDPIESIFGAAKYMSTILAQHGGDYEKAVAGYNWGPNRSAFGKANWETHLPTATKDYLEVVRTAAAGYTDSQGQKPLPAGVEEGVGYSTAYPPLIGEEQPVVQAPVASAVPVEAPPTPVAPADKSSSVLANITPDPSKFDFKASSAMSRQLDDQVEREQKYGTIGPIVGPQPSLSSVGQGVLTDVIAGGKNTRAGLNIMAGDVTGIKRFNEQGMKERAQAALMSASATPNFESETAKGIYGGLSSTLRQLPSIAAGIATRNPEIALGGMVVPMIPEEYGKFRERGASPSVALPAAVAMAGVEYLTEKMPMGVLVDKFGKVGAGRILTDILIREIPGEQVATVVQDAIDTAVANPTKTWSNYLEERPGAAYQTLLATVVQGGIMSAGSSAARRLSGRDPEQDRAPSAADYRGAVNRVFGPKVEEQSTVPTTPVVTAGAADQSTDFTQQAILDAEAAQEVKAPAAGVAAAVTPAEVAPAAATVEAAAPTSYAQLRAKYAQPAGAVVPERTMADELRYGPLDSTAAQPETTAEAPETTAETALRPGSVIPQPGQAYDIIDEAKTRAQGILDTANYQAAQHPDLRDATVYPDQVLERIAARPDAGPMLRASVLMEQQRRAAEVTSTQARADKNRADAISGQSAEIPTDRSGVRPLSVQRGIEIMQDAKGRALLPQERGYLDILKSEIGDAQFDLVQRQAVMPFRTSTSERKFDLPRIMDQNAAAMAAWDNGNDTRSNSPSAGVDSAQGIAGQVASPTNRVVQNAAAGQTATRSSGGSTGATALGSPQTSFTLAKTSSLGKFKLVRARLQTQRGVEVSLVSGPLDESHQIASAFANLFGKTYSVIEQTGGDTNDMPNGFVNKFAGNDIYIGKDTTHAPLIIAAHEIIHGLPDRIRKPFVAAINEMVTEEGRQSFLKKYNYATQTPETQAEEVAAYLSQLTTERPTFWQDVREKMGNKDFTALATHILQKLASIVKKSQSQYDAEFLDKYVPDFKKLQQAVSDAYVAGMREQGLAPDAALASPAAASQEIQFANAAITSNRDGTIDVMGEPAAIRAQIPAGIQGRVIEGGIRFARLDAPRVSAAIEGSSNAYSRSGEVVAKNAMKNGKYIGAPEKFNTPQKLPHFRKMMMDLTLEGERGRYWYERSSEEVLRMVGGDVNEARKFVALLAIYSPQAKVDTNSTFALRAWAQYKAGQPIDVKTGDMDAKAQRAMDNVDEFWSGEKTGNFFNNLLREIDPTTAGKQGATIDMWMMRAGQYSNDAPTKSQYAFMEHETNRIAQELGWEPQQVQAAIWVAMKARMENKGVKEATEATSEKKGWIRYDYPIKNGKPKKTRVVLDEQKHRDNWLKHAMAHDVTAGDTAAAKFDFADGVLRHIGQVSWEPRPSTKLDILPGVHTAPYAQQVEFQQAVQKALYSADGGDLIAMKLGLLVDGSTPAPGVWESDVSAGAQVHMVMAPSLGGKVLFDKEQDSVVTEAEATDIDPNWKTSPRFEEKPKIDAGQAKLLDTYSSILGLLLRQDSVGYHRPFYSGKKSQENGVELNIGRPFTPEEAKSLWTAIDEQMTAQGVEDWESGAGMISSPMGMRVVNFGAIEDNKTFRTAIYDAAETGVADVAKIKDFTSDGNLVSNDWLENQNGEAYLFRISETGRSDLLGWVRDFLAPRVQSVFTEYSDKYDWGDPGQLQFSNQAANNGSAEEVTPKLSSSEEAATVLDNAGLLGKERIDVLKDVKSGAITMDELRAAYPTAQAADEGPVFSNQAQTETPAFNKWFGDSKVVGADGQPMVVYHGSLSDIKEFSSAFGVSSPAFYFSSATDEATQYAARLRAGTGEVITDDGNVMPVYLSIKNPFRPTGGIYADTRLKKLAVALMEKIPRLKKELDAVRSVKSFIGLRQEQVDQLTSLGYDGVIDGTVYIAFNPNQIKSAIGNNGDFSSDNNDIAFSNQAQTGSQWEVPENTKMDTFLQKIQDGKIDLKRVQEAIASVTHKPLAEAYDARLHETLYAGRVDERSKIFLKTEARSLLDAMARNSVTMPELSDYLLARHAPERNAQIAKINDQMPDGGAGSNSEGVLMTTAAANSYIAALSPGKRTLMQMLANKIDGITKGTLDILVNEGLETQDMIDSWKGAYKHYVPLFKDETTTESFAAHGTGSGFSVTGRASQRSMGGTGEVSNMLAHVLLQREAAITRAEKNRVMTGLYGLALTQPNSEFWTTIKPNMPADDLAASLGAMGVDPAQMADMDLAPTLRTINKSTGKVETRTNPLYKNMPNAMIVKVQGEDRVILFNSQNERAMRLIANLKNLDGITGADAMMHVVGTPTRWIASLATQYNPAFGLANLTRDLLDAMLNMSTTEIKGKQASVLRNLTPAMRGIGRSVAGSNTADVWSDLYAQFKADGGQTGFSQMQRDPNERAKNIEAELQGLATAGQLTAGKAAKSVLSLLDGFNITLENAVRLSAYKVALDQGISRPKAAQLARELTIDFNRKGAWSSTVGTAYAFFNASVQGVSRTARTLAGPAGQKIIAGGLALGVIQALMLAAAGFEDDEIPDFVKARALIIPTGGKKYIAIPLPLGFSSIPNASRSLTELSMSGGKDWDRNLFNVFGNILGSFNPLGGGNVLTPAGALHTALPTALDAVGDLAIGKDFSDRAISKSVSPGDPRPGYLLGRESTKRSPSGEVYTGIAQAINSIGGSEFRKGYASPTPEEIRYSVMVIAGGLGREIEKAINASVLGAEGEAVKSSQLPIVGRFAGEVEDAQLQRTRFYDNSSKIKALESEMKALSKSSQDKLVDDLIDAHPLVGLYKMNNALSRKIGKINTVANENINDPSLLKELDDTRTEMMRALNTSVLELEKASEAERRKKSRAMMLEPEPETTD
jgi:hypothetical protein